MNTRKQSWAPYNFSHAEGGKGFETDSHPIQHHLLIYKSVLILIRVIYTVNKANREKTPNH